MHSSESGVTDHLARDDEHALAITRGVVGDLGKAGSREAFVSKSPFSHRKPSAESKILASQEARRPIISSFRVAWYCRH